MSILEEVPVAKNWKQLSCIYAYHKLYESKMNTTITTTTTTNNNNNKTEW